MADDLAAVLFVGQGVVQVTTVRSGKYDAKVAKPLASIGWAIMNSGRRPSAVGSGPRTS